ncbi:MAG: FkbM family methyltransferase [Bacteroidetes bacterium]|nr:MAG: FkbM family methyltransferase [Bacteroidota bacterium]
MGRNAILHRLGILRSQLIYYGKPFNRRRLMRFYRDFVQPGDLCFDVGAHLGNRTDAWLRLGARVLAVDPQPACMAYLKRRFGRHPQVTLVEAAISDQPGEQNLQVSQLTPTITTLAGQEWQQAIQEKSSFRVSWDYEVRVPVYTLDQLIAQHGLPAFCKIDVEDLELPVLQGLSQPLPALSFEYFSPTIDRAIQCIEQLETLGNYTYNWSFGESQRMQRETWLPAAEMIRIFQAYTPDDRSGDVYARLAS